MVHKQQESGRQRVADGLSNHFPLLQVMGGMAEVEKDYNTRFPAVKMSKVMNQETCGRS